MNTVAIARIQGKEFSGVLAAVTKAIEVLGGISTFVYPGAMVLVKPNLSSSEPYHTTNPLVTAAVVRLAFQAGARKVVVGDSSVVGSDMDAILEITGTRAACANEGAQVVNFKDFPLVTLPVPDSSLRSNLRIFQPVVEADCLINLPLLKTAPGLGMSGAMKNLKGVMSDADKKSFHRLGLIESICDLNRVIHPALIVVDGSVACEMMVRPVPVGVILAGTNPVCVDSVSAAVMGHSPAKIPILVKANKAGLGPRDLRKIRVRGEQIQAVRTKVELPSTQINQMAKFFYPGFAQGKVRIQDGKACSGCLFQVLATLNSLSLEEPQLLEKVQDLTILIGSDIQVPALDKGRIILVGSCTKKYRREGLPYVEGCVPFSQEIKAAIRASVTNG